jgi:phosphoribosyl 1,2-cyclic phosphate phosphodiesterase
MCPVCNAARLDTTRRRRPASACIDAGGTRIVIDAGLTDFAERFPAGSFDALLLTHFHADHVQGLFALRWGVGSPIPVYAPPDEEGCADLYRHPGLLEFRRAREFEAFEIGAAHITPLPLTHSKPTFGYAIEHDRYRIAYLTDTVGLPPATEAFLRAWRPDALVLDCSHPPRAQAPRNHNDVTRALACIDAIQPERAWLTHIGHELDAWLETGGATLPPQVAVARDGDAIHDRRAAGEQA